MLESGNSLENMGVNQFNDNSTSHKWLEGLRLVYFLGIGGIGMSALARYFLAQGCKVVSYDKTKTIIT